jgi:putative intracellular protease/amidase
MTAIVVALTPDFADWECALLMAVARSYLAVNVRTASPDGQPVTSMGGLVVTPDLSYAEARPRDFDAIVVPGGLAWEKGAVPDGLDDLVIAFREHGRVTAGICAAASMLAGAGLLNGVAHTGNRLGAHQDHAAYSGSAHYIDGPKAVHADGVVTAAGTAPVTFTIEVLKGLGLWDETAQEELAPFADEHR